MTERLRVTVRDGKYTIIQQAEGGMTFLRNGETWPTGDEAFAHVGMILALAQEVAGLREQLTEARNTIARAMRDGID